MKVIIIDYGMGNIKSIIGALKYLGVTKIKVSNNSRDLKEADKIILPGVGSFSMAMTNIKLLKMDQSLKYEILDKKIRSQINVTAIHGSKDEVVPQSYSKKVLKIFNKAKKKLVIIKNKLAPNNDPKILFKIVFAKNLDPSPIKITLPQVNKVTP